MLGNTSDQYFHVSMLPSGTKQGVPVLIGSSSVDEINKPALVTRLPANKPKHLHTGLNTHTQRHTRVQACSFTKHEPMHAHEHTNNYKRASTHATHTHWHTNKGNRTHACIPTCRHENVQARMQTQMCKPQSHACTHAHMHPDKKT